jgi:hypothetical protein
MKRLISRMLGNIDKVVDRAIVPVWNTIRGYVPLFAVVTLSIFVLLFIMRTLHNKADFTAAIITHDLKKIATALHAIDESCDILSFDHDRNYVDFLNVTRFTGSEVGGLNLGRPQNWKGPYLNDNPTIQEKLYEIVKVKDGVFVVPGDGVELPNGRVVGKDFILTPGSLMEQKIRPGGDFYYRGRHLVENLTFRIGDWRGYGISPQKVKEINKMLKEFNEAIPFAGNKNDDQLEGKKRFSKVKMNLPKKVS